MSDNRPDKCANPIDATVLADYWLAALDEAAQERVEEHLLGCDECGARLRDVIALADGIRSLAREGSLRMVVSEEFLRRAAEEGLRVRQYTPPQGGEVQCTVTSEDNLVIGRLAAELKEVKRVDLSISDDHGAERLRFKDIPFNSAAGSVIYQESSTFLKSAPDTTFVARLVAVDDKGGESVLGQYTFNHTRTLPGPGAW